MSSRCGYEMNRPARLRVDVAELLAALADDGRVDHRQHLDDVVEQQPVEEHLVRVLEIAQEDVAREVVVLAPVGLVGAGDLLVERLDVGRQQPLQPVAAPLVLGERRSLVQRRGVDDLGAGQGRLWGAGHDDGSPSIRGGKPAALATAGGEIGTDEIGTGSDRGSALSARLRPMKLKAHCNGAVKRFLKPVMNVRWTASHISQPRKPDTRMPWKLTIARRRDTAAMLPRSRYLNGFGSAPLSDALLDRPRSVNARLHRDLGHAGQPVECHHVADREHLGMPGDGAVGQHADPAGPVALGSRGVGEHPRQGRRRDARGPDHGLRGNPPLGTVAALDDDSIRVDWVTTELHWISTPVFSSSFVAFAERRSPNEARISLPPSNRRTLASAGSNRSKLCVERAARQLGDLARDLDSGRPASDDHEGQPCIRARRRPRARPSRRLRRCGHAG